MKLWLHGFELLLEAILSVIKHRRFVMQACEKGLFFLRFLINRCRLEDFGGVST